MKIGWSNGSVIWRKWETKNKENRKSKIYRWRIETGNGRYRKRKRNIKGNFQMKVEKCKERIIENGK